MIVTISGKPGAGKSTVAKEVAKQLKLAHYSAGDLWREIAKKKKITILELNQLAEKDPKYDQQLDNRVKKLGINEDNFIIDGRLAFHFIPHSIKIFLDGSLEERAKRVFKDQRTTEDNKTLNDAKHKIEARQNSETKRYQDVYGIKLYDPDNFDYVIDTTGFQIEAVVQKIIEFIKNA